MMAKVIEQDGRRYLEDPEEGFLRSNTVFRGK